MGVIGLLVICLGSLAVFAWMNTNLPSASAHPQVLGQEQAALMEEALHLKGELGDQVWPGFGEAEIPLMTWNENNAFLCTYPQPPGGWQILPEIQVAGQLCYWMTWKDGQNFAEQIGERWAGSLATREWALIDLRQQIASKLPAPLRPVAPVFLLVNEMMRPYRYIGGELHESFHAYQAITMRQRFDDAELAYPAGERYWAQDEQHRAEWEAEIEALYNAVTTKNDAESRTFASQFLELRNARRQILNDPVLVRYEQRFEWLEGLAKYIELHMLRAANEASAYAPMAGLRQTDFNGYQGIERFYQQELGQMKRQASTEGDSRFYYTGFAQAVLLDRWMPDWKSQVDEPGVWIEDLLRQTLAREG